MERPPRHHEIAQLLRLLEVARVALVSYPQTALAQAKKEPEPLGRALRGRLERAYDCLVRRETLDQNQEPERIADWAYQQEVVAALSPLG